MSNRIVTIKDLIRLKDAIEHHRRSIAEYGTCLDAFRDELDRMEIVRSTRHTPGRRDPRLASACAGGVGNATAGAEPHSPGSLFTKRGRLSAPLTRRSVARGPESVTCEGSRWSTKHGWSPLRRCSFNPEGVGVLRALRASDLAVREKGVTDAPETYCCAADDSRRANSPAPYHLAPDF